MNRQPTTALVADSTAELAGRPARSDARRSTATLSAAPRLSAPYFGFFWFYYFGPQPGFA
jgi:hypothetical protein